MVESGYKGRKKLPYDSLSEGLSKELAPADATATKAFKALQQLGFDKPVDELWVDPETGFIEIIGEGIHFSLTPDYVNDLTGQSNRSISSLQQGSFSYQKPIDEAPRPTHYGRRQELIGVHLAEKRIPVRFLELQE